MTTNPRMAWEGSTRRASLPSDWRQRRAATLARDPICRCPGCPRCATPCTRPSTDADHAGDRLAHDEVRGMCGPCHQHRSSSQGGQATATRLARARRTAERHPGLH